MAQHILPRYRGFNLLDLFSTSNRWDEHFPMTHGDFVEDDFRWMQEWGFDFARIPMSYTYFVEKHDRKSFLEERMQQLDRLIAMGEKYHIHISLNFHRAVGYCITSYPFDMHESGNLWTSQSDLELFKRHWCILAERYKGIDSQKLSFDLVNEPPRLIEKRNPEEHNNYFVTMDEFVRVHLETIQAIQHIDPKRLVVIDGLNAGNTPCPLLANVPNTAQSARGYLPPFLTHHKCPWHGSASEVVCPDWPHDAGEALGGMWDKKFLEGIYKPWIDLADAGCAVHVGECGCYKYTPHDVVLRWFEDLLSIFKEHNIGYALWNFRGTFGVLDSERTDVQYEDWHGHKLDRKLLTLLQKY